MADIFELFKKIASSDSAKTSQPITHIVVGLGNPGKDYAFTRHNAGFLTLEYISQKIGVKINNSKFKALICEGRLADKRVLFMQPQTFMNNSGEAVREAAAFYKIQPENILVIFDDISLDVGRMRVRKSGSDGGHNGIKSIIYHLQSDAFPRIKIGVGKKPHADYDLAAWVLSEFSDSEKKLLFDLFSDVMRGAEMILSGDTEGAMQFCNGRRPLQ